MQGIESEKCVLVADDDRATRMLLARQLETAGYKVLTAENGAEAMRLLLADGAQIVIADWMMPEMDGLELCRAIREHEGAGFVYTIILTALHDEDRLVAAFDAGADDFLVKPLSSKELLARVRAGDRIVRLERDLAARTREMHLQNAQLAIVNDKLNTMAITDELTGLFNRRAAMDRLREYWAGASRHGQPLTCISLDIDHFKAINDSYGHDVGDVVLREVAQLLRNTARMGESCCRVGGEEFLVICPTSTAEMGSRGAERLRKAVERHQIRHQGKVIRVTISLGVAERTAGMEAVDDMLKASDDALYVAKRSGRNRVQCAGAPVPESGSDPVLNDKPSSVAQSSQPADRAAEADAAMRVLIVSDRQECERSIRDAAESLGLCVLKAADGASASRALTEQRPELVIVGAVRPPERALGWVREIRAAGARDLPIVMCVDSRETAALSAGISAGADEFVSAAIDREELLQRLRVMVELSRTRRALRDGNEFRGEQAVALGMLLEYSRALADESELDLIIDRTIRTAAFLSRCQRVAILLPNADRSLLRVAKATGFAGRDLSRLLVPLDANPFARVFESHQPLVVNSEAELMVHAPDHELAAFGGVPRMIAPLAHSGVGVGIMFLSERIGCEPFKPLDLEYIDFIGHMVGSAILSAINRQDRDIARDSIVLALGKLAEYRDNDTGEHVDHVTQYCLLLADSLREKPAFAGVIDEAFLRDLRKAAPLHDIGKVGIPDTILLKPGRLTAEEMSVMRQHCQIGADCIRSVMSRTPGAGFLQMAIEIAAAHHEWFDGSGYPSGIAGENIPLAARIAALADVYDALRMKRPYKSAMSHEQAREIIISASGRQFDPRIVEAFIAREADFANMPMKRMRKLLVPAGRALPYAPIAPESLAVRTTVH